MAVAIAVPLVLTLIVGKKKLSARDMGEDAEQTSAEEAKQISAEEAVQASRTEAVPGAAPEAGKSGELKRF